MEFLKVGLQNGITKRMGIIMIREIQVNAVTRLVVTTLRYLDKISTRW